MHSRERQVGQTSRVDPRGAMELKHLRFYAQAALPTEQECHTLDPKQHPERSGLARGQWGTCLRVRFLSGTDQD